MTATFQWVVEWMQTTPASANPSQAVLQVGLCCNGTQDAYSASVRETCKLPIADPANFVPYAQLTQQQVLSWAWANGVNQTAIESSVQNRINNKITPPTIQPPLPWAA